MVKHYIQWLKGLQTAVSPFLMGDDELYVQDNCLISNKLGAIQKRLGYQQIGGAIQAAKPIRSLHNFRQNANIQKMLATCDDSTSDDTQLFYSTGGAWTEVTAAETAWANEASMAVEMEDYISYCFFVGYSSTDGFLPVGSLTGTTYGVTNCTNMPQGKFIKRYRDRLYVANLYSGSALPYRVGISDLPSGATLGWTEYAAGTGYIDVDFSEAITGLESNWDKLFIFTEYTTYFYNQVQQKEAWKIGCSAHRTIKSTDTYMFWVNKDNVWQSSGGKPIPIGGKVIDFIKAGNPTNFFAEVVDEEYHLYIGDVTINGISYANCSIIYNIATKSWRVHEYYDALSSLGKFYTAGDDRLYLGCSDGEVMEMTKYTDNTPVYADDGKDIVAYFKTKQFDFGDPSIEKNVQLIKAYADRAQGLRLKAEIIDTNTSARNKVVPLGQLSQYINKWEPNVKGNFIQIIGTESGQLPYFSFYGLSFKIAGDENL